MKPVSLLITALALGAAMSAAAAGCGGIPDAAARKDGAWLFLSGGKWRTIDELKSTLVGKKTRSVNFAYVAKEGSADKPRRGVVVIKSGLVGEAAAAGADGVMLTRQSKAPGNAKCEVYKPFFKRAVKGGTYDDYHDRNKITDEDDALDSFHVRYADRSGCRWSNETRRDNYYLNEKRNNRSQFSFDPRIVARGQRNEIVAFFSGFVSSAYAARPMADRRVEIKPYSAGADGVACTFFRLTLKPGSFVLINDLERGGRYRADEQSWSWQD